MTLNDLQRAALVMFAVRAGGPTASLDELKAICYVMRNRVTHGWAESWLEVMEAAAESAGNLDYESSPLSLSDRRLQMLARDVDEIFYGEAAAPLLEVVGEQLFYCFINRPISPWFTENIIRDSENHPCRAQIGLMMLYE